jgi:tetratricopeptide (TPR) repeat protein
MHFLSAAIGWMELGNLAEAKAELGKVAPGLAGHPTVLEVTWAIHAAGNNWPDALVAAEQLVQSAGDRASGWLHRAYALRRTPGGGLEAAWKALLPAVDRFPAEATIPYNLACYACQLGQLDEARRWLKRAVAVGEKSKIKVMAGSDADLQPLWGEIKAL